MRNTDYFRNKKITIAGLARSGLACANLLYGLGAEVSVSDSLENDLTQGNAAKLQSKKIKLELGRHTQGFFQNRDLVVVSPGVPKDALPLVWARQFNIPVISEIEVGWILCPGTIIAVTGSNGKTTVTTLIGRILEAAGKKVFICGNVGNPFCGELEKIEAGDFVSLEVSSFQLETINKFKPKIALILNFSANHLDRYKDMREYLEAKKRIFMNQDKDDYLLLDQSGPLLSGLAGETRARVVYFSAQTGLNPDQAAVLAVGSILGIDKELCLDVFRGFKGIEHRLEQVREINNIKFINDSKATTAEATLWALKNISSPVVLIAGGRDKGLDYRLILDEARKKVKAAILIGEAKEKLKETFKKSLSVEEAGSLEEAVGLAFKKAKPGDCVLLSPMCSSFDMFSDYEERGRRFKAAVYELARDKT
ncbi:MAG: UDP-N-acetylmuramoyl-L-alanine--D-glutamate ligase [Candidatus Omnitrophota bacterium]|jgi:UDP-N-acetylmuramoylalanine--D-glutamate ligase